VTAVPPDPEHDPSGESRELFDDALIRTHLANERTFLAWLRTAVVLLGVGLGAIALGGSGDFEEVVALVLGGVSVLTALVMVLWAYVSFGATTAGIERRRYRPPRAFITTATALIAVTGLVVIVLLAVEALD
jgi:putative membrane protein